MSKSATTSASATKSQSSAIIASLETLLSESYSLMAQTHLAHWNVEGEHFFELHTAFQSQYEELFEAVDTVAEHIRTLDAYPPGGLSMLAGISSLYESEERRMAAKDFVAHLVEGHENLVAHAKEGRTLAGEAGDAETEDLFIERLRSHEKTLWMLKSHLK
ncbi:non-specific DNA-binding protein DpsA [soil metagenome]